MSRKLTTEIFIDKARAIHGDKYDYSKVEYFNFDTKIIIICSKHGEFLQTPHHHLNGIGCPKCAGVNKLTTEEFIENARKVHGDRYDYSKVKYINSKTRVCIICPEHGEFWQTPSKHLMGRGCTKCKGKEKLTTEEFIEKARKIHRDKYDYSKVEYVNSHSDICIICPKHGEFYQKPNNHLNGNGCPVCKESHLERDIRDFLKNYNIKFIAQQKFKWLKNIQKLSLDFYLPEYNIAIECQGEQHFIDKGLFSKDENFKKIQIRDFKKLQLCKEHGIKILYFANKKFNDSIIIDKNVLLEKIQECKSSKKN